MPPTTSRDFQKAAAQRLIAAERLLAEKLTLDAQYVGGYTVECSLKALILHVAPPAKQQETLDRITHGAKMHRVDVLLGELRDLGMLLPVRLAKRMRRFAWTTDLRYETGRRDMGETLGFLKTAKAIPPMGRESIAMTNTITPVWESKRTKETRKVEDLLLRGGFERIDAYRYNSASIRLRVIDPRFEGLSLEKRDAMVEPTLARLPERTQADIITLFTFAPKELQQPSSRQFFLNSEFEDPSPSIL